MSSHGLSVPQGWTRGRDLQVLRDTPPVALAQKFTMALDPPGAIGPDDIAYITFDTKEAAARFIRWWQCPCKCPGLGEISDAD